MLIDETRPPTYQAADCWALGVCLYMWLYLKPPFEAPTLYLLLEEIRQKDPPFDSAVVVSEGLMELLLGLLARKPTQRLRIKDVRRSEVLASYGEMPPDMARYGEMPPSTTVPERARVALTES